MGELRVSAWKRYGYDRLYVNRPDGEKVAWLDRRTGHLTLLAEEHRHSVLDILAPYLIQTTDPLPPPPLPPSSSPSVPRQLPPGLSIPAQPTHPPLMPPGGDLAANRPGHALRPKVAEMKPGLRQWLTARLLGRHLEGDEWRIGLAGERIVGRRLELGAGRDWRVLHSIPLPRKVDIDHLLIGPGGAFCVNTKHHRGARVWAGDDMVRLGGGPSYPYVRKSRAEGRRASAALSGACGFRVDVRPVLVFVDPGRLTVVPSLRDVRVMGDREVWALRRGEEIWTPDRTEAVYAAARDSRTWVNA
ncbi:nuclease-related domain-containing protein [Streptomyces sp. NPDC055078]